MTKPLRCLFLFVISILSLNLHAQWSNGQSAVNILGQPDFTTSTSGSGAANFFSPNGVVVDPATGKIFVSEANNNRVVRFASSAAMTNGAAAEAVLGQPGFGTNGAAATQTGMQAPKGLAIDAAGRLWVADPSNRRVLRFDNAATIASGSLANGVLGQTDFTTNTSRVTSSTTILSATSVFCQGTTLWVSDQGNNRILRFDNAAAKANGAPADGVLGQPDFTSTTYALTATGLRLPNQLFVSADGDLWVADQTNHRVLRYAAAATLANGSAASQVLGQATFTTGTGAISQNQMSVVRGIYGDAGGRIYVSDAGNRVLIFDNAASLGNGANASNVLGQSTFTSNTAGNLPANLNGPRDLFVNGRLFVPNFTSHRLVIFTPSSTLPSRLLSFTASLSTNGQSVKLDWTTVDENNVAGYQIEYSDNGRTFSNTAVFQNAKGASTNYYTVNDNIRSNNVLYYRLKTVDYDGRFSYSNVVVLRKSGVEVISLYPNPASSQLVISFPRAAKATLQFFDVSGRLVKQAETFASS
ncbi:MAG: hypothetical protein EOO09_15165, partial [Chitinophagaceae bacterium]